MSTESKRISIGDRVKIFQRGKKKIWTADFHHEGRHCLKSLGTSYVQAAKERALKLEVSLIDGTHRPTPSAITMPAACDDHISYLKTEGRGERTIEKYLGIYKIWKEFLARQHVRYLHQYTPTHYDRFRAERAATRSAGTVYDDSVLIKQLFRWARSRKLLLEDPLAEVRNQKPELQTKFCPTLDQVNAIMAAAPEPLRTQWATLAFSGLRAGELQRLRLEDVDLEGNWIKVTSRPGAKTKTGKSRQVPIPPRLRAILAEVPRTPREYFFTYSGDPADPRPIKLKRLNDRLKTLLPKLRIPGGREQGMVVHSLRHFFETAAVNAGVPQPVVDRWMGHTLDRTVMANIYYGFDDRISQEKIKLISFAEADGSSQTTAVRRA